MYSTACNASSVTHNQTAFCSSQQHHLVPSAIGSKSSVCAALYSPSTNPICSNNCAAAVGGGGGVNHPSYVNHHSSIPHSKSLEHYHEPAKLMENYHVSRHSLDQPHNYKNYDCLDGMMPAERTNGYHYGQGHGRSSGIYHQPNCSDGIYNVPSNRYPLPATLPNTEQHYAQIANFDRSDNSYTPVVNSCCHQNPHYECLNNFNARN